MKTFLINTTACDGSDALLGWILWMLAAFILGFIIAWLLKQVKPTVVTEDKSTVKKQDLTKIEGIGPKIQGLLYDKGIETYESLSNQTVERLEKIIIDAGPAYTTHRGLTITWQAQAKLAQLDQWEELSKWQDLLKRGV